MPRPKKCRRVCSLPEYPRFGPLGAPNPDCYEHMTVDEYETIRLIDLLGCTQEECARRLDVARTTVQAMYDSARKKLAAMLVNGSALTIQGGEYALCPLAVKCPGGRCGRDSAVRLAIDKKEETIMKIAVTYEAGQVFQHFGHCAAFALYHVEDGNIVSNSIVPTNGTGHGALAGFLKDLGVDTLICGGIGQGARDALGQAGIRVYPGVQGDVEIQVRALLQGTLQFDPDTLCSHHGHEHGHEEGHCGHGSCGH
jgi:predicted DNA-binding protein (UPF0251 family)/predicted Fe-Mo cluster-binding NifX family protein